MVRRLMLLCVLVAGSVVAAQQLPARPATPAPTPASDETPPSYDTPPAITLVDGTARLVREGQSQAAVANMPLVERDRLVTEAGRVEVTYPDGTLLHVDRNTTVDFLSLGLVRALDGRVIFVTSGRGGEQLRTSYQIDAPAGSVYVDTVGEYRVSVNSTTSGQPQVELAVISGSASLATDAGQVTVDAGERSWATDGSAPANPETFNSARLDAFDRWSEAQRSNDVATGASTQYLPPELDTYAASFDRGGRWDRVEPYGEVWYPQVSSDWRPYYNGYWDYVGPYGWTWIGFDAWAWPTHHFGRWGFNAGRWFWAPTRFWGPGWVSWGSGLDLVGWCPLDFFNRPLVNIFIGDRFGFRGGLFDPWRCWTFLPRRGFGERLRVAQFAVSSTRIPQLLSAGNFSRRRAIDAPTAVSRGGAGDFGRAVPRALSSVPPFGDRRTRAFDTGARGSDRLPSGTRAGAPAGAMTRERAPSAPSGWTARSFENRPSTAQPRGGFENRSSTGQPRGFENRPQPVQPRGFENRPSTAQPRGSFESRPQPVQPRGFENRPSTAQPRGSFENRPPVRTPSAPSSRYQAPSRAPSPAAPRYQPPARTSPPAYRYEAPSRAPSPAAPRYQPPARTSPPAYRAPSASAPRSQPAPRSTGPAQGGARQRNDRGRGGR